MARFYRTASASPMDYMYQLNIPLMRDVLASNEAGLNMQLQQAGQVGDLATKFSYLTPDSDRARQISQEYSDRVDEITQAIQQDPMNWKSKKNDIRGLAKDLEQNYRVGEISKIAGNYAKYKELDDYISKREEAGKLTPHEGSVFRQRALESLKDGTGYDANTGRYAQISTIKPIDTMDIRERLSKAVDGMKASEGLQWDTQAGQYFKKTTRGKEYISQEKIIETAMNSLMGDNELQQYLQQRSSVGLMRGVFDDQGKFISPYNYVPYPTNDAEKQQISTLQNQINKLKTTDPGTANKMQTELDAKIASLASRQRLEGNSNSSLYPVIASLAGEYSYEKVKDGIDLRNNSLYNLGVNLDFQGKHKNADRQLKREQFGARQEQAKTFHDDIMALNWYKALNPPEKDDKSPGTKKKKDSKVEETIIPTSTGNQDATPWLGSKFYTNQGLAETLDQGKADIDSLSKKVRGYQAQVDSILKGRNINQLSPEERQSLDQVVSPLEAAQNQLQDKAAQTDWARQWYTQSLDYALNGKNKGGQPNLTEEEKQLYNSFRADRNANALKKDIEEYKNIMPYASTDEVSWLSKKAEQLLGGENTPEAKELFEKRLRLTNYMKVKEKVDKLRDFYLDKAKTTANQAPTIEFGTEDKKAVAAMLQNKTHGLQLFNSKGAAGGGLGSLDGTGISWFDAKGDNRAPEFADGSIQKYLEENNGEIEYLGVSPSLGFSDANTGAVARVRFKNKKGEGNVGDIPSNKDFYVTLDPQTQQSIGLKYSANPNAEIARLGKQLLSGRDQQIRNRFMDIRNQVDPQTGSYGPSKRVMVPIPGGELPVTVRSFYRGDGDYDYYVTLKKSDGTEVPMKSSGSSSGFFDSIDHFINDFNNNLQNKQFE